MRVATEVAAEVAVEMTSEAIVECAKAADQAFPSDVNPDEESAGEENWQAGSNLTIFYKASPHFGGKWTSFVAVMAQNTYVYDCRLILYQFEFNISLLSRFMKPRVGIMDEFLLQPHHFLSKKSAF